MSTFGIYMVYDLMKWMEWQLEWQLDQVWEWTVSDCHERREEQCTFHFVLLAAITIHHHDLHFLDEVWSGGFLVGYCKEEWMFQTRCGSDFLLLLLLLVIDEMGAVVETNKKVE